LNPLDKIKELERILTASREHQKQLQAEIEALQDSVQRVNHSIPLPRTGLDYAFAPHPPVEKLKSAGISFVCRYLTGEGKALTELEARDLSNHGLDIVALYEENGREVLGGYNAGVARAHSAMQALDRLKPKGQPPVIFTADFDPAEGGLSKVSEFIRGAVHTIGWYRVGIYGGFDLIQHLHAENRCKFYMQTYAWSRGKWSQAAQLRQVINGVKMFGADTDVDKAMSADFGQFRV
jgi:hypothetical protein